MSHDAWDLLILTKNSPVFLFAKSGIFDLRVLAIRMCNLHGFLFCKEFMVKFLIASIYRNEFSASVILAWN